MIPKTFWYSKNRKCLICGKPLKKRAKAFCSIACRNKIIKRTKRTRTVLKKCKNCGKQFSSFISENRKFHNNACRIAYFKLHPNRPWLGKKRPEVKKFLTMKGRHHTEEWKQQISKEYKNRKVSEEQKIQISRTLMGHPANPGSGRGKSGRRKDIKHYCRSTWEANLARTLLYDELNYQYEPQRFYFDEFTYLPDFYISDLDWWIEIKGYMDEIARKKIAAFTALGLDLFVISRKEYQEFKKYYKHKVTWE